MDGDKITNPDGNRKRNMPRGGTTRRCVNLNDLEEDQILPMPMTEKVIPLEVNQAKVFDNLSKE